MNKDIETTDEALEVIANDIKNGCTSGRADIETENGMTYNAWNLNVNSWQDEDD